MIQFCETESLKIESDLITTYESLVNKKLYPGDPVRLFLETLAAIITQQRILIDFSAKQNLLMYAQDKYLDEVVALVGVKRLEASPAVCTVKFVLSDYQQSVVTIPKGTRLKAGEIYFKTVDDGQILPNQLSTEIVVECMQRGIIGNGLLPGQINSVVDEFPYFKQVFNTTLTSGGADIEDDEALRRRAFEAPHSFSNAGSDKAYAFWAKTVSPEIADVQVISPEPGKVTILAINKKGELISEELKHEVLKKCSEKHIKPLTDFVEVKDPLCREYNIKISYWIDSSEVAISQVIQENIQTAIEEFISWQQTKIGRDINPSELLYRVMGAKAKRVMIQEPHFEKLELWELATLKNCEVIYEGIEDE